MLVRHFCPTQVHHIDIASTRTCFLHSSSVGGWECCIRCLCTSLVPYVIVVVSQLSGHMQHLPAHTRKVVAKLMLPVFWFLFLSRNKRTTWYKYKSICRVGFYYMVYTDQIQYISHVECVVMIFICHFCILLLWWKKKEYVVVRSGHKRGRAPTHGAHLYIEKVKKKEGGIMSDRVCRLIYKRSTVLVNDVAKFYFYFYFDFWIGFKLQWIFIYNLEWK